MKEEETITPSQMYTQYWEARASYNYSPPD